VPAYTNGGEKEETERRGQGVEAEFLLSFISSHFRRSPRYQSEFTTYRIYRSDDTSRMVIGTPRREFSRGGRVEEREADFLMFGAAISASRNFEFARNDTKSTSDRGRNQSWRVIAISEPMYREGR